MNTQEAMALESIISIAKLSVNKEGDLVDETIKVVENWFKSNYCTDCYSQTETGEDMVCACSVPF